MYVLRSKVKVADAGPLWFQAGISGEGAAAHLERIFGTVPHDEHHLIETPQATLIRLPGSRYEILLPRDSEPATLAKLRSGTELVSPAHWSWLDIRAGVPVITPPTQEQFVPQMVNMDLIGGLSFSKGCYPGQEIVARMHFLGTLKQRMYLAHLCCRRASAGRQALQRGSRRPGERHDRERRARAAKAASTRWRPCRSRARKRRDALEDAGRAGADAAAAAVRSDDRVER